MFYDRSLQRELVEIEKETNAQTRGIRFERLVQRLFERSHYRVKHNAGAARPRQTDLVATYGDRYYLIEVKWRESKADINDIDSLRSRLGRTPSNITGIFFSMAGFTQQAVAEVEARRERPILLSDGDEIEELFNRRPALRSLIHRKEESLTMDGRVLLDSEGHRWARRTAPDRAGLPAPDVSIWAANQAAPWIAGQGDFNGLVFAQDLPDIDWTSAQGFGVGLDVYLDIDTQQDIAYALDILKDLGWITSSGRFSIQQSGVNWHGTGAAGFLEALDARESRYTESGRPMRHTEEAAYFDVCEGGLYTLFLQIEAHAEATAASRVYSASLSAQLPGIPLDPEPFRRFAEDFELDQVYFRPLASETVRRNWNLPGRDIRPEVLAFLRSPSHAPSDDEPEDWVSGIVARNPFFEKPDAEAIQGLGDEEIVRHLAESELLVCRLSSWRAPHQTINYYYLRGIEATRTGDVTIFQIMADWNDLVPPRTRREKDKSPAPVHVTLLVDPPSDESHRD